MEIYLNFHGLGEPARHVPSSEKPYWLSTERFEQILKLVKIHHTRPYPIHLTFDDGNDSDANIALPLLLRYQLSASFFVLTKLLNKQGYLSNSDLMLLAKSGMTVGTHGLDHANWTTCNDEQLAQEFDVSIDHLQKLLHKPVDEIAIPFGIYDRRVIRELRKRRFSKVYTSDGGYSTEANWITPRTSVRCDTDIRYLETLITGRIPPLVRLWQRARIWRKTLF